MPSKSNLLLLLLRRTREVRLLPLLSTARQSPRAFSHVAIPRAHQQPASPSTDAKEAVNSATQFTNQTVNPSEIAKFSAMAESWWDIDGPFRPLHLMNPVRLSFIRSALCRQFKRDVDCPRPLEGLTIVDVGCGGGLLCEPLARMGGRVIGIDAAEKNIMVATAHSIKDPATASIDYRCTTAEQLVVEEKQFDIVIALELIEHVKDPKTLTQSLSTLTKRDGAVVISTINRSITGYLLAIVAAEHLLHWVPKGTHEWSKFITPEELALLMSQSGLLLQEMAGMVFNPLTWKWTLSEDTSVNYIAFGTKS